MMGRINQKFLQKRVFFRYPNNLSYVFVFFLWFAAIWSWKAGIAEKFDQYCSVSIFEV